MNQKINELKKKSAKKSTLPRGFSKLSKEEQKAILDEMEHKKTIETSKKLLIVSDGMAIVVAVVSIIAVFCLNDTSPFMYLIPAVFGLAATSHGFYYWKAKNENMKKFGANCTDDTIDDLNNNDNMQGGIM